MNAEIDLCDIANEEIFIPYDYDIVGFASLSMQNGKAAFVLNTFGGFTGQTQTQFAISIFYEIKKKQSNLKLGYFFMWVLGRLGSL
ncbi:MAG: hypothetical protein N4A63_06320 [Vallitalea sp.]|jgi:hypothetical protein|nr:hypothetical protein [Vallitalea sp.]